MSSKSRKAVDKYDHPASELESQRRLRTELARSSTMLRRATQPSEDTLEAIEASLEAALAELDQLEQPTARRRMPPPLPRTPPPLPRQAPPLPAAAPQATPVAGTSAPLPVAPTPRGRRAHWPQRLLGALALVGVSLAALRFGVPEHPAWAAIERATAKLVALAPAHW